VPLLDIHVGRPLLRGGLTLFPVWNGAAVPARGYDVHTSAVTVAEQSGPPVVNELVVANGGQRPVLVLEGELLEGGHQHRVTARSAMVAAGTSSRVAVHCVEQGRWGGGRGHARGGRRAPLTVRAAVDQAQVWDRVSDYEQRYAASATHSFLDAVAPVEEQAARLVHDLRPLPFQSGLLVGVGGHPLLLEVYDSPRTLAAVWDGLLRAVALDALAAPAVATPGRRARRFADRVVRAPLTRDGEDLRGRSPDADVRALLWRGRAVHTVAVNPRHELVAA
jgi:hypothetical protein